MAIVDMSGNRTKIDVMDTMVFCENSQTILFNRGTKLYFSAPRIEKDKVFARFIRTPHDFVDFALFIGSISNLDGDKKNSCGGHFLWQFLRKTNDRKFSLNSGESAIFENTSKYLHFFSSDGKEIYTFYLPFIKSENDFDELLIILGYFFDLSHQFIGDSSQEKMKRVFL